MRVSPPTFSFRNIIFIITTATILSGCAVAVVGGAGTAGYYAGKDEREMDTIISDAGITTSINSKLLFGKGISTFDINIDTFKGNVTASGKVPSIRIRNKVLKLCKETQGVKKVINKLKVIKEN